MLRIYVGRAPKAEAPLDGPPTSVPDAFLESQRVILVVEPYEDGIEYQIRIGDVILPSGRAFRTAVEWEQESYFDSARGRTVVTLWSRPLGTDDMQWRVRAQITGPVTPSKLTEDEFQTMVDDLASLSTGLVYDLVSKSLALVPRTTRSRTGNAIARSGQMELRLIEDTWARLGPAVAQIVRQPESGLQAQRQMRACTGEENLSPTELMRIVARGVDPRHRALRSAFTAEVEVVHQTLETRENRVIAAFLDLLLQRLRDCRARAEHEIALIEADRWFRDRAGSASLFHLVDEPRIATLHEAARRARATSRRIASLRRELPVSSAVQELLRLPITPVFANVPHYHAAWRIATDFMGRSAVTVEWPVEERAKPTWRMYEQWVFLQIVAAIRQCGFRMCRQREFIAGLGQGRFSADLQRGTEVEFPAHGGRKIVVRYEPWIFSRDIASARSDRLYRGTRGEVPWCPDVLIEVLDLDNSGRFGPVYAVAVDAKYSRRVTEKHLADVMKYAQIRALHSGESVVRQVWLALPIDGDVVPDDPGVEWTATGPTAPRTELITGSLGLRPIPSLEHSFRGSAISSTAASFVGGLLSYCDLEPLSQTRALDVRAA